MMADAPSGRTLLRGELRGTERSSPSSLPYGQSPLSHSTHPSFWSQTDIGTQRETNEDSFLWLGPDDTGDLGWLWLVCDGMGGASAGELASATVCQVVAEVYPTALRRLANPHEALREAFDAANRRLLYMQRERAVLHRMGTTAVALAYYEGRVWIATVGDSRVYVLTGGKLRQLTTDQTQLQKLLQAGVLKPEESVNHPSGNVLVSALGRSSWEFDTLGDRRFDPHGSSFLVCSDGLSSFVEPAQIQEALEELSAKEAAQGLVELARETSGDNITATVIHFHEGEPVSTREAFLAANGVRPSPAVASEALPARMSFDFNPKDEWDSWQTGAHPAIVKTEPITPPAAIVASDDVPPTSAEARPQTSTRENAPVRGGIALNTQQRETLRDASARRNEPPALDDAATEDPRESRARRAWIGVIALLSLLSIGLAILLFFRPAEPPVPQVVQDDEPDEPIAPAEPPTPHHEPLQGDGPILFERVALGAFEEAKSPRRPDFIHLKDRMPAFRVANGQLMMDAHEVTVGQFRDAVQASPELRELHAEIDEPRYSALPCSSGSLADANDLREPVCVSPQSAAVYCAHVGRRLPSRGDWRALTDTDKSLVATGFGRIFRYGSDGPPPPIPSEVRGIYGVWDGLPESLHATPLDLARGDVATLGASMGAAEPIIVDARLSARFLVAEIPVNARPMLGFRCVWDIEKSRPSSGSSRETTAENAASRIHPVRVRMDGSPAPAEGAGGATGSPLLDQLRQPTAEPRTP